MLPRGCDLEKKLKRGDGFSGSFLKNVSENKGDAWR